MQQQLINARFIWLSILILLPNSLTASNKIPIANTPSWVKSFPLRTQSDIKAEDTSDGYLFLLKDYQVNLQEKTTFHHYVKKIFTETGVQNGSEVEVSYDPSYEKLIFHDLKIIRDGKVLNRLDPGKFKVIQREKSKESFIYDESLSVLMILEDVRAGDLIEYAYSNVGTNPIYGDKYFGAFNLQAYDPIEQLLIRIIAPEKTKLHFRQIKTDQAPTVTHLERNAVYEWNLANIPGLTTDADLPTWYEPYPYVWISEFSSWAEVKDWALALYQTPAKAGSSLGAKIAEIQSGNPTDEKRLEATLRFIQDEIRYTGLESGISGYKPQQPSKVFAQRFGDCKDKALLFCYMLNQMGIEAYPALVNTDHRQEIKKWLPSPHAFDHCIAQVKINRNTYWYDPTLSHQRGRYNTIYCPNYKVALVIGKETQDLMDMPVSKNAKSQVIENFSVPEVEGAVSYSIETRYSGREADAQRAYFSTSNLKEVGKGYLNFYAKSYPRIKVGEPLRISDDETQNVFTTYEAYEIENFFYPPDSLHPKNLECQIYPHTLRDKILIPSNPIRTMPVGLVFPTNYEHLTRICLPEAWKISPDKKSINHPEASFTKETDYEDDTITIQYSYQTLVDHVPGERSAQYTKEQKQIIDQLGYSLTYNQEATVETAPAFRVNGIMVLLALMFLLIVSFVGYRIYQYDPQPEYSIHQPEAIGGWLVLVAIGLVVSPFNLLVNLFTNTYFDQTAWENITLPSSPAYNPSLTALLVAEMCYNIFSLVSLVVLIRLFFKQRSSLPRLITIYYGCSAFFLIGEAFLLSRTGVSADKNSWQDVSRTIITAAIWVPYFNISRRVKRTFVNTLKPKDNVTETYHFRN